MGLACADRSEHATPARYSCAPYRWCHFEHGLASLVKDERCLWDLAQHDEMVRPAPGGTSPAEYQPSPAEYPPSPAEYPPSPDTDEIVRTPREMQEGR